MLPNGTVLVTSDGTAEAELYDPTSNTWRAAGRLKRESYSHAAAPLPNGGVLVSGGRVSVCWMYVCFSRELKNAQIYHPGTGTWSRTRRMLTARIEHVATPLQNGRVLVTGGIGPGGYLASAELYDPQTGSWSAAGRMAHSRVTHTATVLWTGQVLVAGGWNCAELPSCREFASAELYTP